MSANDFLDTNILVYLLSGDPEKADIAERLVAGRGVVSVQVLNEFASVVTRKFGLDLLELRQVLARVRKVCRVVPIDVETHDLGLDVVERYRVGIYDALIIAAALQAGCTVLHTEDLSDGQSFGRLTVRNPFLRASNDRNPARRR